MFGFALATLRELDRHRDGAATDDRTPWRTDISRIVSIIQSAGHNISLSKDLCGKPYLGPLMRVIQSFRDNYLSMKDFGRKLAIFAFAGRSYRLFNRNYISINWI
jgi:hypothetical protein